MSERPMIEMQAVTFTYPGGATIFEEFSWQVGRGEAWAVIGPSGCGKTTLLNLLAGLSRPTRGQVRIDGQPLSRPRPRTGLVLQDYGLLPWATLGANAALGLEIRAFYGPDGIHAPADEVVENRAERVAAWLKRLGILHLAQQYPHQVSGGQRQRTAIARTLALNPDVLLMDEPFGALDEPTRHDLQRLTRQLRREQGLTSVIVTHNIEEAAFLGDHILVLGQPVHRAPTIVHNPCGDEPDDRSHEALLVCCRELRRLIGEDGLEPGESVA
jgi:ABC-type nitrate/sulfonate/bicarbonate transport system ATPase subunit